ncbi:PLP-dependent aminotransferase family protein [Leucobacter chromiiresistens]|uniref:MocR-like pyridoxine biosynthesis transcription factor PdxR n=1 Tax=Leucobacter chromiiresistens TaxID=1079994 RepID=UPI0007344FA2|nr:PLP-dependent aminotransferase family protein [Leucobacter chromiiresistens]
MRHRIPVDLVLDTTAPPGATTREHLVEQLRDAVLAGQIAAGAQLPSSRSLAAAMGCSRGTVIAAFEELIGEGYCVSVPGSGTFVAADLSIVAGRRPTPRTARPDRDPPPPGAPSIALGGSAHHLSPGSPSTRFSGTREWQTAWRRALRRELPSVPPPPAGDARLRELIADHLLQARGVRCDRDDVLLTAGTNDGIALLMHALRAEGPVGARIATEEPGYPASRRVIRRLGGHSVGVPVRGGGIDIEALRAQEGPFAGVLLTPSHQYPLGGRMPVAGRLAVLDWAREHDALVIEDDYDSEFRHGAPALPAIASLDDERRVALVGSYSKTLSPWLRCGYVVVRHPDVRERALAARADLGLPLSGTVQHALAEFLESGGLRRHLARAGRAYAHRRTLVIDAFAGAPGVHVHAVEAGLHATLTWEPGPTAAAAVRELAARGVTTTPLHEYYDDPASAPHGLVLGYGAASDVQLHGALQHITEVLAGARSGARSGPQGRDQVGDQGSASVRA